MQVAEINFATYQGFGVHVYGTPDAPLFIAQEIAAIIGIVDIDKILADYKPDRKMMLTVTRDGINCPMTMLTLMGLFDFARSWPKYTGFNNWINYYLLVKIDSEYNRNQGAVYFKKEIDRDVLHLYLAEQLTKLSEENAALRDKVKELTELRTAALTVINGITFTATVACNK